MKNTLPIRAAMFDFDGTISLIRAGWQGLMATLMLDALRATPTLETDEQLAETVAALIARTTGQPTITQMATLGEEVAKRGGSPAEPATYKRQYLRTLSKVSAERTAALKNGNATPDALMVPGVAAFLAALHARGMVCYLASGTDEPMVRREAALLGVADYFAGIFGARDDDWHLSKRDVVTHILRKHHLRGDELVAIGDGPVEILAAKEAGAHTLGIACDETAGRGLDPQKRRQLLACGAEIVIADFSQPDTLPAWLGLKGDRETR